MPEDIITLIVIALIIAFVAAAAVAIGIVVKYKKKLKSPIYPIDKYAALTMIGSYDHYMGTSVTRVRVASKKEK